MKLTVFTPTYNRANLLVHLFDSLQHQTCQDFEWLVIDDGSTDDTANIIEKFQSIAKFPIVYYKKDNGGKHTAYNAALSRARGRWFVCVDSDDLLTRDAVSSIIHVMDSQPNNQGVIAYKATPSGELLGNELPHDVDSMYLYELGIKYNCTGDYLFALETKIAKKYPFPILPGERFVPESLVWDSIKDNCLFYVLRQKLMLCEYQPGGLSMNFSALMGKNPNGFRLYFMQRIDLQPKLLPRMIHAGKYHAFHMICKNKDLRYTGPHRFLVACAVPLGLLFRLYYKLFRNI